MQAGKLHYRIAFDEPTEAANGQGGVMTAWAERFCTSAAILFLRGGETVQSARLEGRQPAVITIRNGQDGRRVTTDWRARDERSGAVYNIRAIVPTDDRAFIELTCESGVAV